MTVAIAAAKSRNMQSLAPCMQASQQQAVCRRGHGGARFYIEDISMHARAPAAAAARGRTAAPTRRATAEASRTFLRDVSRLYAACAHALKKSGFATLYFIALRHSARSIY